MDPKFDLAKLVGAASAPVALVIATCIYLGNLTTIYNTVFQKIRDLAQELRQHPDSQDRCDSIKEQLKLYEQRICNCMRASFLLNLAIVFFIGTVLFTGVSMLMPGNVPIMMFTAGLMFVGLLLVGYAVITEMRADRLSKPTLDTELQTGTPDYEPVTAGRR